ncbi:Death-associated protein kinase related [Amphibalanus amphitrite]|uniref:Death-associated protein kinase related n=1 Tax=Amphibalanus amphitrite TaxID=1232801 RepID=A0A6A4WLH6_AMPAM|nr:Death-associated protein kinase related [Amphibalanus amphitrite]
MRNLLEGLVFIHERNLAHLDIKVIHHLDRVEGGVTEVRVTAPVGLVTGGHASLQRTEERGGVSRYRLFGRVSVPTPHDCRGIDFVLCVFQPQNLVLTGEFPDCEIKLCDLEISRVITAGTEVREMLGTPDYVGKHTPFSSIPSKPVAPLQL